MAFLDNFKNQTSELLAQQPATMRAIAGVILAAVLVVCIVLSARFGRTVDYELLYAGLDAVTAAEVKSELQRMGIPFKPQETAQGWSIKVPEGKALTLRLDLATTIEASDPMQGWALFDDKDFGSTFFSLQIKKQRAIMGELARTIKRMEMVKSASVQISIPEESLFIEDREVPTASVMIEAMPGAILTPEQVHTIQSFVSGSIVGLQNENVTVSDTRGNQLSRTDKAGTLELALDTSERMMRMRTEHRTDYEKYLEDKILAQLRKIFGRDHVTASVNVEYDYTEKRESKVEYDSKKLAPVSEAYMVRGEGSPDGSRLAEGIVGSSTQVLGKTSASSGGASGSNSEYLTEKIINNLVGKTETDTVHPEYQIQRVTAAVNVDNFPTTVEIKDDDDKVIDTVITRNIVDGRGNITEEPNALTDDDVRTFEDLVKGIINFSEERPGGADVVTIINKPFSRPPVVSPVTIEKEMQRFRLVWEYINYALLALGLVVVYWFLLRPLLRIVTPSPAALPSPLSSEAILPSGERVLLGADAGIPGELAGGEGPEALPAPEESPDLMQARQEEIDDEILDMSRSNPKKVPLVLRSWIES